MKIFKFGGASIRNSEAIKNLFTILSQYQDESLVVVVSAMGKTTNQLENLLDLKQSGKAIDNPFNELFKYHMDIMTGLSFDKSMLSAVDKHFFNLKEKLFDSYPDDNPDRYYDEIVSFGEILSSTIVYYYLHSMGYNLEWKDARKFIKTDNTNREAEIDWKQTRKLIQNSLERTLEQSNIVTQGFIGSAESGQTTTLGREGSDFSAAIIASCLNADSVTIWKDVPGILNADPKKFTTTKLFPRLSYQESAELTYYGASVIHPKTIRPLANLNIPLLVKSFDNPTLPGTIIGQTAEHEIYPAFIIKENQCLITFRAKDLTFINEHNLSIIFHVLDMLKIKMNMMQNSAVSFTICIDDQEKKLKKLIATLENDFVILYNRSLNLFTVKNYTDDSITTISEGKKILVEQRTRNTYQIVVEKSQQ